ncbi:copper amine oxidase N-terminal domain-containing protein [Xylanibacillus composti]|uniref:Copper amine oxidase-like N-terminal domain-containing protein n=1 Tax=Xylanibacillus composti TaxID=1572762 RepID=A0A8J4M3B3_9BACL|nr:copper amine oxidase N-terminal domain-containing protein [Xylanibacillus composti]GIQ70639.1 hypothetical protein XYCOK13_34630 [Xylanibacillus composti]
MMAGFVMILVLGSVPLWIVSSLDVPPEVKVNGEKLDFADVLPYIDKQTGRTLVPAREIAEKLGAEVSWNRVSKQGTIHNQQTAVQFTVGEQVVSVNGKEMELDAPVAVKNGRTMVPLGLVGESLGADVRWIEDRRLVLVTSSDKAQRATWIWDSAIIERERDRLLQFAAEQKLTAIYIRYDTNAADREAYRAFIRSANDLGIQVEALAGASDWIYEQNQSHIKRFIAAVAEYNSSVDAKERFQGYHFDIEPYTLDDWHTRQTWVLERWMETIRFIETEVRSTDPGMTIFLDIPFWIGGYSVPGTSYPFSAWLLEKADGVVIMAYRNTASGSNGIMAIAKPIILEASTLQKSVIVAVDTLPSKEGDHTTFHAVQATDMEAELQVVMEQLSPYPSYAGVAVHDYARWTELWRSHP